MKSRLKEEKRVTNKRWKRKEKAMVHSFALNWNSLLKNLWDIKNKTGFLKQ